MHAMICTRAMPRAAVHELAGWDTTIKSLPTKVATTRFAFTKTVIGAIMGFATILYGAIDATKARHA